MLFLSSNVTSFMNYPFVWFLFAQTALLNKQSFLSFLIIKALSHKKSHDFKVSERDHLSG
jgi:hypothetical protein